MNNLPVLVYGTLRPGCGNYSWALQGRTVEETTVRLQGLRMYAPEHGGFPYATQGGDEDQIVADLITVEADHYQQVLSSLDNLEGFYGEGDPRNFYDRHLIQVNINGRLVQAWIYLINDAETVKGLVHIRNGDWIDFDNKISQARKQKRETFVAQDYEIEAYQESYEEFWNSFDEVTV